MKEMVSGKVRRTERTQAKKCLREVSISLKTYLPEHLDLTMEVEFVQGQFITIKISSTTLFKKARTSDTYLLHGLNSRTTLQHGSITWARNW